MILGHPRHALRRGSLTLVCFAAFGLAGARAANLYTPSNFAAMTADRHAEKVGDSLTVIINESSTASNSAQNGATKSLNFSGQASTGTSGGSLAFGGASSFDGNGQTGRTGKMVAQISVVVDGVLPNGDLHVAGDQSLNINGERTKIHLSGRVRLADISSTNAVLSTSLADAVIDYDGKGFLASSVKPGLVTRVFNWLGLL